MERENLSYILIREDRIVFDCEKHCFEAIFFPAGNEDFRIAVSDSERWNTMIDDYWALVKGECYSIE